MNAHDAMILLADEAEKQGATADDRDNKVRPLVEAYGFGFNAWLCVCCELADRSARKEGFRDQVDRAFARAFAREVAKEALK